MRKYIFCLTIASLYLFGMDESSKNPKRSNPTIDRIQNMKLSDEDVIDFGIDSTMNALEIANMKKRAAMLIHLKKRSQQQTMIELMVLGDYYACFPSISGLETSGFYGEKIKKGEGDEF